MPEPNWEDHWDQATPGGADPCDIGSLPISPDEMETAQVLFSQARYLALNREPGNGARYCLRDKDGLLPTDDRPISPAHSAMWFTMVHHGTYWEVSYGSREFSSSFSAVGRGLTLKAAFEDCFNNE